MQQRLISDRTRWVNEFINRLKRLSKDDRAILKRNVGRLLSESRGRPVCIFYNLIPKGVPISQEEIWFAVATLYAFANIEYTESAGEIPPEHMNFGWTLQRLLRNTETSNSNNKKLYVLFDSHLDIRSSIFFKRIRSFIQLAKSKKVPINWEKLLLDIISWNHPTRYVQKSWARAYFCENKEK